MTAGQFTSRLATPDDLPVLRELMDASIRSVIGQYLDTHRVEASFEIMGVDSRLIDDGTYFVVDAKHRIAGCGGWRRAGKATAGRTFDFLATKHESLAESFARQAGLARQQRS